MLKYQFNIKIGFVEYFDGELTYSLTIFGVLSII